MNVTQSCAVTPYKTRAATFYAANAIGKPMTNATADSIIPCRTTNRLTPFRVAPSASRTPISRVLLLTAKLMTPYNPTQASSRPESPKIPNTVAAIFGKISASLRCS